jgi:flavin reductase (DIM6/NTAB) family NADH-FMN oxidoreductase RutF
MIAPFEVDFSTLPLALRYKLLAALVVPRPIALVTTAGKDGIINAAPFSFFNVFSEDPALVVLGLQSRLDGTPKDTLKHIRETGVFVVNLVDEAMAERMNTCSIDFPSNVSEIGMAGFAILPGVGVPVPRIAEAPVALECRHYTTLEVSHRRHLCIGSVVHLHARPGIIDPERLRVNLDAYKPIARLFGNLYARLGEKFVLKRQSFTEWEAENGVDAAADRAKTES